MVRREIRYLDLLVLAQYVGVFRVANVVLWFLYTLDVNDRSIHTDSPSFACTKPVRLLSRLRVKSAIQFDIMARNI